MKQNMLVLIILFVSTFCFGQARTQPQLKIGKSKKLTTNFSNSGKNARSEINGYIPTDPISNTVAGESRSGHSQAQTSGEVLYSSANDNAPHTFYNKTDDTDFNNSTEDWTVELTVNDNRKFDNTLKIGVNGNATDGIDKLLGEYDLPPMPPFGVFDTRILLPEQNLSSLIDYRAPADTIEYIIQFQAGSSGYPFTITWDNNSLLYGKYTIQDIFGGEIYNVNMNENSSIVIDNGDINRLRITYIETYNRDIVVEKGWNMVSIPFEGFDMEAESVFSSSLDNIFSFDNGYVSADTLKTGKGYWVEYDSHDVISFRGSKTSNTIEVDSGWNFIGIPNQTYSLNNLTTDPLNIIASNFYTYIIGRYFTINELKECTGYWVKFCTDGTLTFHNETKEEVTEQEKSRTGFSTTIRIRDDLRNTTTLYLGIDTAATDGLDSQLSEYELPPYPPKGAFDARLVLPDSNLTSYNDYRAGGDYFTGTVEHRVKLQYASGAELLALTVNIPQVTGSVIMLIQDADDPQNFSQELREGKTRIEFDNQDIKELLVKVFYTSPLPVEEEAEVPTKYGLSQNFPNPFNPSTTISFALPVEAKVKVTLYNALGEKVSEVANRSYNAGVQAVNFDASELASGMYIYQISAQGVDGSNFVDTKKMMLMK